MKPEIYELDGVKRCKIKVNDHETVDRIATEDDIKAATEEQQAEKPAAKPAKKDAK